MAVTAILSFLVSRENFLRLGKIPACKQLAMSRQSCDYRVIALLALPLIEELYSSGDSTRSTCVHVTTRFRATRGHRDSFRCRSRCAAESPLHAKPRRARHRSCMASCSIGFKPKESSPTARRSPTRSRNPRPAKSCADTKRRSDREGFSLTEFRWRELRHPEFRGERIPDSAARGNPRAHRQAVGRADVARRKDSPGARLAASAVDSLRGARRALSRDVLLGFLLHDGGSADQRPRRSRGRHGRELCGPHRSSTGTFRMAAAPIT